MLCYCWRRRFPTTESTGCICREPRRAETTSSAHSNQRAQGLRDNTEVICPERGNGGAWGNTALPSRQAQSTERLANWGWEHA